MRRAARRAPHPLFLQIFPHFHLTASGLRFVSPVPAPRGPQHARGPPFGPPPGPAPRYLRWSGGSAPGRGEDSEQRPEEEEGEDEDEEDEDEEGGG